MKRNQCKYSAVYIYCFDAVCTIWESNKGKKKYSRSMKETDSVAVFAVHIEKSFESVWIRLRSMRFIECVIRNYKLHWTLWNENKLKKKTRKKIRIK